MRSPSFARSVLWGGLFILAVAAPSASAQEQLRREEAADYYEKWLNEDVLYIVTDEERAVFASLTTEEERESFIEQFWERRNPDPLRRSGNDFKEEHYRRIAFANERYHAGVPGWRTDRGKIYIIHGPPNEIKTYSAGSVYVRDMSEGGGTTRTYPMEVWRYRRIEGLGNDISLEFVDRTLDGNYQLALDPWEKDALLYYPTMGMTLAEESGLANREDRPFFNPTNRDYPLMNQWGNDSPFQRYALYARIQAPPPNVWRDFERLVQVNVAYNEIPVRVYSDFFRLNEEQLLVPITLEVDGRHLTFAEEAGSRISRVSIHGIVRDLSNRIVASFEEDLAATSADEDVAGVALRSSVYQRVLTLEARWRYKLDLVVRDQHSGRVGIVSAAIIPPTFDRERLELSSLLLADLIRPVAGVPEGETAFVLGDVRVRPRKSGTFAWNQPLGVYFHAYNVALDQSRMTPELETTFRIRGEDGVVFEGIDAEGTSIHYISPQRVVMIRRIPLDEIPKGRYSLEIEVRDRIASQEATLRGDFEVVDPPPTRPVEPRAGAFSAQPSPR